MNTSDLSGNESSEGSGKKSYFFILIKQKIIIHECFIESPGQIGDDYTSADEPFTMRSAESNSF